MRNFKRLFFWDMPAKGVFFGMTMLMALPWIYFTLFCVLIGHKGLLNWVFLGSLSVPIVITFIILSIQIYPLFVYAISLGQTISPQTSSAKRWLRWAFISVLFLLSSVFTLALLAELALFLSPESFALSTFCIFLFLFGSAFLFPSCGAKWKKLAIIFLWPIGFIGLSLIFAYGVLPFFVFYDKLPSGPPPIVQYHDFILLTAIRDFLMISGVGWKWLAIMTFLCIFSGYVLQAQALCRFWKFTYRELLSKRAIFVLSLCLLIYLVSLPFALINEAKYRRTVLELKQHFGKDISVQNAEYEGDEEQDSLSWEELIRASENISLTYTWKGNFYLGTFAEIDPLASEWEEELLEKWEAFYLSQKELEFINDFLDNEIPPAPRQYRDLLLTEFYGRELTDLTILRTCFKAQQWQLIFAIENDDAFSANRILTRMQNICTYLYRNDLEAFLIWQEQYLLALCRYIESGLADMQWLASQLELLDRQEADSAFREKRECFHEVLRYCTLFDGIAHRLEETSAKGAELSQLRCLFPQAWWPASAKANAILRAFENYLATGTMAPADSSEQISEKAIGLLRNRTKCAIVQTLCAKTLLEAEMLKRKTGSYPEKMASLPLDPFTQKTLQYEIGIFEYETQVVRNSTSEADSDDNSSTEDCDCGEYVNPTWNIRTSTAKMLRVFSPGYNHQTTYEDICFFIRLE